MTIKIYDRQSLNKSVLFEQIINLDLRNMEKIMQSSEMEHPIEKRKLGFNKPGKVIAGFDRGILAGYLEYGIDFNNRDDIYISSIQVLPRYRNTILFSKLVTAAKEDLKNKNFINLNTNVQKSNLYALKLFRKLGFTIEETPEKPRSFTLTAKKEDIIK